MDRLRVVYLVCIVITFNFIKLLHDKPVYPEVLSVLHVIFSSTEFASPEPLNQLSKEVFDLKLQLEAEVQQKEEAIKKAGTLDGKVAELQLQLQVEAQQRTDATQRMTAAEKTVADLERHLQTEAQQKEDAIEKTVTADKKAADLERQLSQTEQSLAESKWVICL